MATVDVGGQFVEKVLLVGNPLQPLVPEVVVRIADGKFRLQSGFLGQGQPVIASEWHREPSRFVFSGPMIPYLIAL